MLKYFKLIPPEKTSYDLYSPFFSKTLLKYKVGWAHTNCCGEEVEHQYGERLIAPPDWCSSAAPSSCVLLWVILTWGEPTLLSEMAQNGGSLDDKINKNDNFPPYLLYFL